MSARLEYQMYLRSPAWRRQRRECFGRFSHRCAVCNSDAPLHAHHRTYERLGCELDGDLTALCAACHSLFHEHRRVVAP